MLFWHQCCLGYLSNHVIYFKELLNVLPTCKRVQQEGMTKEETHSPWHDRGTQYPHIELVITDYHLWQTGGLMRRPFTPLQRCNQHILPLN